MKIKINGKEQILDSGNILLQDVLKVAKIDNPQMVTVQLNGEFVAKESFGSRQVKEGDQIDFLYFMGGGRI